MSNIKFEIINGTLCRMVEPEPLMPDSKFPCLARLIQDDSQMGKYNRRLRDTALEPLLVLGLDKNSEVVSHNNPRPRFYPECYEIIGYPVEDGSHYWALYQMMQGYIVKNSNGIVPFMLMGDRIVRIDYSLSWDIEHWLRIFGDTTGWQLYEPEPEPQPAKEPIANCDNCKHICTNSNIDHCHMYEPKPAYAVGDWVEYFDNAELCHAQIDEIDSDYCTINPVVGWDRTLQRIRVTCITRKPKPSEVVVHIGCLSGTVEKACDFDLFLLWHSKKDCDYSMIRYDALDEPTHKLVNELLEKQKEEKNV